MRPLMNKNLSWHRYWWFAVLAIVNLSVLFIAYGVIDRRATLRLGEGQASQISEQTALAANGTLQASHQLIHAMGALTKQSGKVQEVAVRTIAESLRHIKSLNSQIMDLLIIDRTGRIIHWTGSGTPPVVRDREYYRFHTADNLGRLYVGDPQQSRVHSDKWFFALSEALRDASGELEFVLAVIVDTNALRDLMAV